MAIPTANDDLEYMVDEDAILRVNPAAGVLVNDTDADGDGLSARVLTDPQNPLFDVKTDGSFVYDARYHGELEIDTSGDPTLSSSGDFTLVNGFDSLAEGAIVYDELTYAANDGQDDDDATARVAITGVNDAPVADDDAATFQQGGDITISIDALANDTDVDIWPVVDDLEVIGLADLVDETNGATDSDNTLGDGLSITTLEGGTATLNVATGEIEYTAAAGFFGIDTIQYTVGDGKGGSDTGEIRITVLPTNVAPDAVDDSRTVSEDAGVTSFATVLGNDTDADDAPLIAADLKDPIGSALRSVDMNGDPLIATDPFFGVTGTLVDFNDDGTFDYNPNGEFESLGVGDSAYVEFDYTGYDGHGLTDEATVTLEVQGENDNPTGESPAAVKVYEAGLATGSQDHRDELNNVIADIPIVQDIDITIDDVDASDTPFVAGTTGGDTTTLNGTYGDLEFLDDDTVRYTLNTNADHTTLQGHNGGIYDDFSVWVVDEHGGFSDELTVSVQVIDDINFLAIAPVDGTGTPLFTADTLDNTEVAFVNYEDQTDDPNSGDDGRVTDAFSLVPGADGQTLDVVGIPDEFTLADGRTVTSAVYTDTDGNEAVRGTDSDGETFYEIEFDPDPDSDASTLLGAYTLTLFQTPPTVINDLDFSAISAGPPLENPIIENIGFDGGFFTDGTNIFGTFDTTGIPSNNDDFINPNNAGGIGIGDGNVQRFEALEIDVTGSTGTVAALELDVEGVGGGIGEGDILWEAVDGGVVVDSGSITVDLASQNGAHTISIDPDTDFDFLYVALAPDDFDGNDKMRINRIATVEEQLSDDIKLGFRLNSDDGDSDQSPAAAAIPNYEEFLVTVLGDGPGTINEGIIEVA